MLRNCTNCKLDKPLDQFYRAKQGKYGVQSWCKMCSNVANKIWQATNKERRKNQQRAWYDRVGQDLNLRRKYNITKKEYDMILESQDFKCAICETHISSLNKILNVDHDHKSNRVRGLLCYDCNRNFIGNHVSSKKFERAVYYLNHYWINGQRTKV